MVGGGATQERTWMYMSPSIEDFLDWQKMGTEGWHWEEVDGGVETGESVLPESEEVAVLLFWAGGSTEDGRDGVGMGEEREDWAGRVVDTERQGGAMRRGGLRRLGGARCDLLRVRDRRGCSVGGKGKLSRGGGAFGGISAAQAAIPDVSLPGHLEAGDEREEGPRSSEEMNLSSPLSLRTAWVAEAGGAAQVEEQ